MVVAAWNLGIGKYLIFAVDVRKFAGLTKLVKKTRTIRRSGGRHPTRDTLDAKHKDVVKVRGTKGG